MHTAQRHPLTRTLKRRGFTIIELLVVIVIIGILIAILVPVVGAVRTTARIAEVKNDISQLESAITAFRATYGIDPPSSITIYEAQAGWDGDSKSRGLIRRMWPQFNFTDQNLNGDMDMTDSVTFTGAESLIFFLGGIVQGTDTDADLVPDDDLVMTGFSKNPAAPFAIGGSREGPFFEFESSRLRTRPENGLAATSYLDPLPGQSNPIGYVHSDNYTAIAVAPFPYRQNASANSFHKPKTFQILSPGFDGEYGNGGAPSNWGDADKDNIMNFTEGLLEP